MVLRSTTIGVENHPNNNNNSSPRNKTNNVNFKGFGSMLTGYTGYFMNSIENGGFIASFLIQDTLGMSLPRIHEGLYRDRDRKEHKFKDLNFKEASEVAIREMMSGPLMMFVPMLVFFLTKKFIGKTTFTNTGILKNLGKTFSETVKNKKAGESAEKLKETFYKNSIKKMVEETNPHLAGKLETENLINKIYKQIIKVDEIDAGIIKGSGDKKALKQQLKEEKAKIVDTFNNIIKDNSTEFQMVNKVKLGDGTYSTSDSIDALRSYFADVVKNKNIEQITENDSKKLEKSFMIKRIFATTAASLATIGSTSIVPKIYAILNPVSPSAMRTHTPVNIKVKNGVKCNNQIDNNEQDKNNDKKDVSFKGNPFGDLQFNGNHLTPLLMLVLTIFGLLIPRINTAIKRAPVDENGNKDLVEVPEILIRDLTSAVTVLFGVPLLSKIMINLQQKRTGFVLTSDPTKANTPIKKFFDTINPLNKNKILTNKELESIYGHIESKEQLINFTNYIDKNNGDLSKIFGKLDNSQSIFTDAGLNLENIKNLEKKEKNKRIIDVIKNKFNNDKVKKLMEPTISIRKEKVNGMYRHARGLNSIPNFINTFVIIPIFLGIILPKIGYVLTAKRRDTQDAQKQNAQKNNVINT